MKTMYEYHCGALCTPYRLPHLTPWHVMMRGKHSRVQCRNFHVWCQLCITEVVPAMQMSCWHYYSGDKDI